MSFDPDLNSQFTVAVITRVLLGVLNPDGTPMVRLVVPTAIGSKAVSLNESPPENTNGLTAMTPTEGVSEVTGTLMSPIPPRSDWYVTTFSVVGSRRAAYTRNKVFAAATVVEKLPPGLTLTKPEGVRVMVPASDKEPAAVAVTVAIPVLSRA